MGIASTVVTHVCCGHMQVERYLQQCLGATRLQHIKAAIPSPSLRLCLRVNNLRTTPDVSPAAGAGPAHALPHSLAAACMGTHDRPAPNRAEPYRFAGVPQMTLGVIRGLRGALGCHSNSYLVGVALQAVVQQLRQQFPSTCTPWVHRQVPQAVIVPGNGPLQPDYQAAGEVGLPVLVKSTAVATAGAAAASVPSGTWTRCRLCLPPNVCWRRSCSCRGGI
jgi:hypothetical protein